MSYEIHAIHREGSEPVIETGERFISAFEGRCGDGWVLSVDRRTQEGTLMSNDIDEPRSVSKREPYGNLMLDPGEALWLKACWMNILRVDLTSVEKLFEEAGACALGRAHAASGEIN